MTTMKGLICGKQSVPEDPDNWCDINGIANPDNVAMMHGHKMLIIGEDTTYSDVLHNSGGFLQIKWATANEQRNGERTT